MKEGLEVFKGSKDTLLKDHSRKPQFAIAIKNLSKESFDSMTGIRIEEQKEGGALLLHTQDVRILANIEPMGGEIISVTTSEISFEEIYLEKS